MSLLLLIATFCFPAIVQAQTLSTDEFANQVMSKIKNADFDSLFNDYVLPKDYTAQNIQSDKEAITACFKELTQNEIGSLESFSKIDSVSEEIVSMDLATGSRQTTGNLPAINIFYQTTFSKLGSAYILIGIYKEGEKLFIKNISIGLPKANTNSVKIVQNMYQFMSNIANKQQKNDSTTPKEINVLP
jgi:hypothetical protein